MRGLWLMTLILLAVTLAIIGCGGDGESPQPTGPGSSQIPAAFEGTWEGRVSGEDFRFRIASQGNSTAENLTVDCTGTLEAVASTATTLAMEVHLESGPCLDRAIVVFDLQGADQVNYRLFDSGTDYNTGTPLVEGPLTRTSG